MKKKIIFSEENQIDLERIVRDNKKVSNDLIREELIKFKIVQAWFCTRTEYDKIPGEDIDIISKIISLQNLSLNNNE